ncbi:gluconate 2-dehydrogenase subunit 3 family protein [Roseomonas sp. GC11]|uniref:gluconate 2-dehydrogenase subunit 3 family protein n=1 Tax=Roseomonas sp. GC11 TaxID=2950546 RepID=UPI002108DD21|nr:gluconate 2-dehydrogenase subunit 3 family protein [Roseomonas sp. GC11]MCQ4159648.1 gluconate 2-dehydrogenase subunit 3 family protein [Roseomonas sp. GC11]
MSELVSLWRRHVLSGLAALPAALLPGGARAQAPHAGHAAPPAPGATPAATPATPATGPATGPTTPPRPQAWLFLNPLEVEAVEALMGRLLPADGNGPGAREAGGAIFLDRQLAGAWGAGAHLYTKGPIARGTAAQGYQLGLAPAELFRLGLAQLDEVCRQQQGGRRFAELDTATQDQVITALEKNQLALGPLPGGIFFSQMMEATLESFFADPIHGGNQDMVGWKLVGFPGYYSSYFNVIERHNLPYNRPPVSLADHAHARHGDSAAPEGKL